MQGTTVLACADAELIGMNLVDERHDVMVGEVFYKGEKVDEEKLAEMMRGARSMNLFGPKATKVAMKHGFLTERGIIRIAGVEHAIIFKV